MPPVVDIKRYACLSGENFARRCDVVFAEVLRPDEGRRLAFDHTVVLEDERHYIYVRKTIDLRDGDTIYCKTDFVGRLFRLLKWRWGLKDIKLVTGQSDYPIGRKAFGKKPRCIAKWYAVNVEYHDPNLVPIPLGLQNYYSIGGLKIEDVNVPRPAEIADKKLLYINHSVETNEHARQWAYDRWSTNDWLTVDAPDLTREQYVAQLDRHAFLFAPWGNGVDTHRLWEALYHGIVPVTDRHLTHRATEGLPVLLVDSMERQIDRDFLLGRLAAFRNRDWRYEKLNVDWWYDRIKAGASI